MDTIQAKQVNGAVDKTAVQDITGEKTFKAKLVIDKKRESHHMVMYQGFVYWAAESAQLEEEGNYRMGIIDGFLTTQQFIEGTWQDSAR